MTEAAQPEQSISDAVAGLWGRVRPVMLERVDTLELTAVALLAGNLDAEARDNAYRVSHKLVGSLGTYGFPEGSRIARGLELLLEGSTPLTEADGLQLSDAVVTLREIVEGDPAILQPHAPEPTGPVVLVATSDDDLAQRIEFEGTGRGLRVQRASDIKSASSEIATGKVEGLFLDLALSKQHDEVLKLMKVGAKATLPAVVIGGQATFAERVAAVRSGALGFFARPLSIVSMINALERGLGDRAIAGSRVLVVDDDPITLDMIEAILVERGMTVFPENDPASFWAALRRVGPDLIVLDFDMPNFNGVELCRVLRADPQWRSVPVVFLTSRADAKSVQAAFAAGADDYVTKKKLATELAMRVENRLQRSYAQPAMDSGSDSTTDRARTTLEIERLMQIAKRTDHGVSVAIVRLSDLDFITSRFGLAAGREILTRLATQVQVRMAPGDVLGVWSAGELTLAWFDATAEQVVRQLGAVLKSVRAEKISTPEGSVQVSFTGGVASYPSDGVSAQAVIAAADDALTRAGGASGEIVIYSTPDGRVAGEEVDVVLVEDDVVIADLLMHALRLQGHSARHIMDGDEAIDLLGGEAPPLCAKVILLDIDLIGRDGLAVLRELKRNRTTERTHVVMLTARSTEREVLMTLELGATDHVAKPFSVPVLLQRVRTLLHHA